MGVKQTTGNRRVGDGTPGPGRPKGSANKATAAVREAIALFAENNIGKLQEWVEATAKKDPAKAADLFLRALEYHTPRLSRATIDGELGIRGTLIIDE